MSENTDNCSESGFTLVEILVVISITVLLTSLAISYDRSSSSQLRMFREEARIVNLLNRAKTLAMERYNEPPTEGISVCGVGLFVEDSKNFAIYQDTISDPNGQTCDDDSDFRRSDSSEDVDRYTLGDQVEFVDVPSEGIDILFVPPHLDVRTTSDFPVEIGFENITSGDQVEVEVSRVGQINTIDL